MLDKEFYTLREYLLLTEGLVNPTQNVLRSIHESNRKIDFGQITRELYKQYIEKYNVRPDDNYAVNLVAQYDVAKASWEKYGNAGPPVGCKVIKLRNGGNDIYLFGGPYTNDDRFFVIYKHDSYRNEKVNSLILVDSWWHEIQVLEDWEAKAGLL